MERPIQKEVAQAILRGERDYAQTLQDMDLVRATDNVPMRPNTPSTNEIQGRDFVVRRLRQTV